LNETVIRRAAWPRLLLAAAGLLGAAGVGLAAAAAHRGGANLDIAANLLMIHAAAVAALALAGRGPLLLGGASLLALGVSLFSGDIAMRAFAESRLFPMAAPSGGVAMIVGWLALTAAAASGRLTKP
jgi:uncharacterized membrane protein YgdD (TMEM256/DUF423 family)